MRPATLLCWRRLRLNPIKPPFDTVDPGEDRRQALGHAGAVEFPDLPGGPSQVGVIQPRGHIVLFSLGEEPAEPQRLFEERESRIEWALPLSNTQRNLPREPRTDVIMAAHAERIKAQ